VVWLEGEGQGTRNLDKLYESAEHLRHQETGPLVQLLTQVRGEIDPTPLPESFVGRVAFQDEHEGRPRGEAEVREGCRCPAQTDWEYSLRTDGFVQRRAAIPEELAARVLDQALERVAAGNLTAIFDEERLPPDIGTDLACEGKLKTYRYTVEDNGWLGGGDWEQLEAAVRSVLPRHAARYKLAVRSMVIATNRYGARMLSPPHRPGREPSCGTPTSQQRQRSSSAG
jgi:hypothetical protein